MPDKPAAGIVTALMIGDVVGEPGLQALEHSLRALIQTHEVNFTVVNGENAANGFGLTPPTLTRILDAGADVVTSGNHIWEKRELWPVLDSELRLLRPANYPPPAPGRGSGCYEKQGIKWGVINVQGRLGMAATDCPFRCAEHLAAELTNAAALILVDFHAESGREKEAFSFFMDGKVGAIVGTHTHVQTADQRLLPKGSASISDLGMTGVTNSIIGMDVGICLDRSKTGVPYKMECASGPASICGALIRFDAHTRRALAIDRVNFLTETRG